MSSKKDKTTEPHSTSQFGKQRDFWWNKDFLDLMSTRWELSKTSSLADIGCGLAHWSRALFPYLKTGATVVGVDNEPQWVNQAFSNFKHDYPAITPNQVRFLEGNATSLPLENNSFDTATCQTLLMHLSQPQLAVTEMVRIIKPDGIVICVEPNNLFNTVYFSSLTKDQPTEKLVRKYEFWLRYQRGKIARGQGNNSIGDLLPGMFAKAGLTDIQVYLSDRAAPIFPPYNTSEQRVLLEQERHWRETKTGPWDEDILHKNANAGKSSDSFIQLVLKEMQEDANSEETAIQNHTFHTAGGGMNYLVSGRKLKL